MKSFEVSRNSWHYKLVRQFVDDRWTHMPRDLCNYYYTLVIVLSSIGIKLAIVLFLLFLLISHPVSMALGLLSMALMVGVIFAVIVMVPVLFTREKKFKRQSLLSGFVESRVNRYCRKIEFTGETD